MRRYFQLVQRACQLYDSVQNTPFRALSASVVMRNILKQCCPLELLLLLFFIGDTSGSPWISQLAFRILGGTREKISDVPYVVQVAKTDGRHFCGGALLAKDWVLTAAHCIEESSVNVRAGTSDKNDGGQIITMSTIKKHPEYYKGKVPDYDFALLKLARPLKLDKNIDTISLASSNDVRVDKECAIAGWGNVEHGEPTNKLMSVWVPIVDWDDCKRHFRHISGNYEITEQMLCAGGERRKGDSGGPLVCNGKLAGISSWTTECGEDYGVYADVTDVKDWIKKVIDW